MTAMRWFVQLSLLVILSAAACATRPSAPQCGDWEQLMTSIHALDLSGSWQSLTTTEVQRRWRAPAIAANDDFVSFEETPSAAICGCFQVAHFHSGALRSLAVTRNESDRATAIHHQRELVAAVQPSSSEAIVAGSEEDRLYRWMLDEEEGSRRQLGLEITVSRCGSGWQLHAVVSLFQTKVRASQDLVK